jgi:DNA-binding SARP family transcriptional activator
MGHRAVIFGDEINHGARLFLLGRPRAVGLGGGQVKFPRLALILAAFILLESSKMRMPRSAAASFLWEDLGKKRQAGNLRQLLSRLRAIQVAHGAEMFQSHNGQVVLCLRGADIDVSAFRACGPGHSEQAIAQVCKVYSGDLLAGLNADGEKLSAWLETRRVLLRTEFVDAIAPYLEERWKYPLSDTAMIAARRIVEADPFQEAGYRILMRAHAERGKRAAASQLYYRLDRLLTAKFGRGPSSATKDLHRALVTKTRPSKSFSLRRVSLETHEKTPVSRPAMQVDGNGSPRIAVLARSRRDSSSAVQELVDNFSNDLASRFVQTRAVAVSSHSSDGAGSSAIDVDYIVEVRARQDVASVRLLATSTREFLWAGTFESVGGSFADNAQMALVSIIRQIENREIQIAANPADATSSYRATLEGRRLLRNIDLPSIRRARKFFRSALAGAPDYIPALAGLSRSYVMEWLVRAPFEQSSLEVAAQCARRAISASPDDHRGYQELGLVNIYLKRLDESIDYLSRARRLNPDDMGVRVDLADALVFGGQASEAIRTIRHSQQLHDPSDDYVRWTLAGALFGSGDYRAALAEIEKMTDPAPAFRVAAASHALLGEAQPARRIVEMSMEFNPGFKLDLWLSMVPICDHEFMQRYSDGLRQAGFR